MAKRIEIPKLMWGLLIVMVLMTGYTTFRVNEFVRESRLPSEGAVEAVQDCKYTDGNITIQGCPMVQQYVDEMVKRSQGNRIWEFEADCQIETVYPGYALEEFERLTMKCKPNYRS